MTAPRVQRGTIKKLFWLRKQKPKPATCPDCSRDFPHIHCPECGSVEHAASECDMLG